MNLNYIGREVTNWEKNRWRMDIESKTTLELYMDKRSVGDEGIYCNGNGSVLLFQCGTNTLKLRWRKGFEGGAVNFLLYEGEEETEIHFYLECVELKEK